MPKPKPPARKKPGPKPVEGMVKKTFWLSPESLASLEAIRTRHKLTTEADAVRLAIEQARAALPKKAEE